MSDFFELDPLTGIRSDFTWNENDQEYTINRSQNVEPSLDWAALSRNELGLNRKAIKESWWHYCHIPPIVQLQLLAKGLELGKTEHMPRILEEINTHYPHLKMTTGKMGGKEKKLFVP